MSMNLAFKTKSGNHLIEFPYQTSTNISYDVMKAPTLSEKMSIIKNDLISFVNEDNPDDVSWYNELVRDIEDKLKDETLELIIT